MPIAVQGHADHPVIQRRDTRNSDLSGRNPSSSRIERASLAPQRGSPMHFRQVALSSRSLLFRRLDHEVDRVSELPSGMSPSSLGTQFPASSLSPDRGDASGSLPSTAVLAEVATGQNANARRMVALCRMLDFAEWGSYCSLRISSRELVRSLSRIHAIRCAHFQDADSCPSASVPVAWVSGAPAKRERRAPRRSRPGGPAFPKASRVAR
jgi:hypothetical protein